MTKRLEVVKTNSGFVAVSDEEIANGDYVIGLADDEASLEIWIMDDHFTTENDKKVVAASFKLGELPMFDEPIDYASKILENWENELQYRKGLKELKDDADKDYEQRNLKDKISHRFGYIYGVKHTEGRLIPVIKELKSKNVFTEQDLIRAFNAGIEAHFEAHHITDSVDRESNRMLRLNSFLDEMKPEKQNNKKFIAIEVETEVDYSALPIEEKDIIPPYGAYLGRKLKTENGKLVIHKYIY